MSKLKSKLDGNTPVMSIKPPVPPRDDEEDEIDEEANEEEEEESRGKGKEKGQKIKMSKAERKKQKAAKAKGKEIVEEKEREKGERERERERERVDGVGTEEEGEREKDSGGKGGKKSKLKLKLEQAQREKEREKEKEKEREKEIEEEREREKERKREKENTNEREREKEEEEDVSDKKQKKEKHKKKGKDKDKEKEKEELSIEEIESRMKATMFGDEVHSEYSRPVEREKEKELTEEAEEEEGGEGEGGGKKKKKSNKEKKKAAKEAEAKERLEAYNTAALKASQEGAQFAVSQTIISEDDMVWANSLDIVIPDFSISAHNKELLVNTELTIAHGRRYGLVGPNGAGKSTLLKMIASKELKVPPRVDLLYVEQEVLADDTPAVEVVLKADKERWQLVQEEKQLTEDLEKAPDEAKDLRLGEVHEALANMNAAASDGRARRILYGLGFDKEMQTRPTRYFSGGWRMRISLARALFLEPTLLMLDEPTNHLDLNAVIWLDDYLQKWKKTLLVVSHDQDFLNSVCEEILHLEDKKVITYKGNYDTFKEQEATRRKQQQKAWEKQEKRIKELKSKGVTKEKAEQTHLKSKSREPGARAKKSTASAQSSGVESNDSRVELVKRPREYVVTFSFPEVVPISPPILEVRDVNFRYGPTFPWLFQDLNFGLDMSSRICIVGPNGSGKSTIIKLITGEVTPPEGEVRRNPRLRVGVYNQHFVDRLPMDEDPVTYLRRLFNEQTYQMCRNILGRYGLEGHAHTIPIRDLSGGQKARVVMVELSLMAPHLLFLDEPTNNLDIESIDALSTALKAFNGGVVLVSHDARLIETTECQLWVVEDHNVTPWESGFAGYRSHLLRQLEDQVSAIIAGGGERPGEKKI
eukprot:CAMPEP_0182421412 /NCGR_PEP_ID=MMETSP1167-20130531/6794_1 /TAXON_ID=2988 /ORGANISM="Mallomonas Sp, Strain CCMP3275" /LENGTH=871 /DNA_ID=CAMNT_0024598533 /DNA_START=169 /DNA_END=2784 /DNA_ORIENTATION=-